MRNSFAPSSRGRKNSSRLIARKIRSGLALASFCSTFLLTSCSSFSRSLEIAFQDRAFGEAYEIIDKERAAEETHLALLKSQKASVALRAGDLATARTELRDVSLLLSPLEMLENQTETLDEFKASKHERLMNALYRAFLGFEERDPEAVAQALSDAESASSTAELLPPAFRLLKQVFSDYLVNIEEPDSASRCLIWIDTGLAPRRCGPDRYLERESIVFTSVELAFPGRDVAAATLGIDLFDTWRRLHDDDPDREGRSAHGFVRLLSGALFLFSPFRSYHEDATYWSLLPARSFLWYGTLDSGVTDLELRAKLSSGEQESQTWHRLPIPEGYLSVYYFRF